MAKRKTYRNGDSISLVTNGCDGCAPSMINGTFCHEQGCPDAWRDTGKECFECGYEFYRTERHQNVCNDCQENNEEENGQ